MRKRKRKKFSRSTKTTTLLAVAAVILLGFSALGTTRAALVYKSENYTAEISVSEIGVSLVENGKIVSNRDYSGSDDKWLGNPEGKLLKNLLGKGEKIAIGKRYNEKLSVKNTGTIDQYVRVRVYKSWQYEDGTKETRLSPDLLNVNFVNNEWMKDESASTTERTVLYYPYILKSGEESPAFVDAIQIDSKIMTKVKEERTVDKDGRVTIKQEFLYNGVTFHLEAEVDAVQTHNAQDAIKSAWGVDVNIASDGTLSLAQ